jgi:hypothetical protein
MIVLSNIVLIIAIIATLLQIVKIRNHALNEGIAIPIHIATVLIFSLCILGVVIFNLSPFHLLWMFPISLVLGIFLMLFPFFQKMTMIFLHILTMPKGFRDGN